MQPSRSTARRLAFRIAVAALCAMGVRAQDPPPPPGGFALATTFDQTWTWSDGYVTRFDFYAPLAAAPATGWPVVLANHGSQGSRKIPEVQQAGRYLAQAGYVVYAFDQRGDGQTPALNPTWTAPITQERELLDQAESIAAAQALLPGTIDGTRWAITGFSGGGRKALHGAAWSGKPLPLAGLVATHPPVLAVAPEIAVLDVLGTSAPMGVLAADFEIQGRSSTDPVMVALQAEDYAAYAALLLTPFNVQAAAELGTSTVPALGMWAAQDNKIAAGPNLDAFNKLLSMPRRMFLSTGGHSTVANRQERLVQQDLRRRWFDHYLKGIANGADLEAFAEAGVQPSTNAAQADLNQIWEHRQGAQWPLSGPSARLWLRGGGVLATVPPPAVEAGPVLRHRVQPGFDLLAYAAQGGGLQPGLLFARIPRVVASLDGPALGQAMEIVGRPTVRLFVDDTTGNCQITALLQHVDPFGATTWITMGTAGVRTVPGRFTLDIPLDDVAHVVPAGHRLRLTLLNLADHAPPGGGRRVRLVPYFTDTDSTVLLRPGAASELDLPVRGYATNLSPRLAVQSAAAGLNHVMRLSGGAGRGGLPYAVAMGGSGEAPGWAIPGSLVLPVNPDAYTVLGINALNSPTLPNSLGILDAMGRGAPGFVVPAGPVANALAGLRLTFAAVVVQGALFDSVSGASNLIIDP